MERIGPYEVERELGRGGMGAVFLARDPRVGRRVAIKLVTNPDVAVGLRRFHTEAQATARLRHPAIVTVHELGEHGGRPYLVLDPVEGGSLKERLARGPLPPREAAELAHVLAGALAHAHAQGVLHRDLKPANVLLTSSGAPVLSDFGLARDLSDTRERLTRTGELLGTPAYMSPEQADGRPGAVDRRSDVYGLGATLYAALTGRPPFEAPALIQLLSEVLSAAPAPPSSRAPEVPPALDAICLRALAKEPDERYATAGELADALTRWLEQGAASPRSAKGRALAVGAAVVGALALAGSLLLRTPADPPTVTPPSAARDTTPRPPAGWERADAPGPTPRYALEGATAWDAARGQVVLFGGADPRAHELGDTWTWDGAAWTHHEVQRGPGPRYGHALSYDPGLGEVILLGGWAGGGLDELWSWDGARWRELQLVGGPGKLYHHTLVYDPGRRVHWVFGGEQRKNEFLTHLWSLDLGGRRWVEQRAAGPSPRRVPAATFDPLRRRLVVFGGEHRGQFSRELWEWDGQRWWDRSSEPGPAARRGAAFVFAGERVVLFGGEDAERVFGDLWAWDGERWSELSPPVRPPARTRCALVWDATRGEGLLFGGRLGEEYADDTWRWRR